MLKISFNVLEVWERMIIGDELGDENRMWIMVLECIDVGVKI